MSGGDKCRVAVRGEVGVRRWPAGRDSRPAAENARAGRARRAEKMTSHRSPQTGADLSH